MMSFDFPLVLEMMSFDFLDEDFKGLLIEIAYFFRLLVFAHIHIPKVLGRKFV